MKPLQMMGDLTPIAAAKEWTAREAAFYSAGFAPLPCATITKTGDPDLVMEGNVRLFEKVAAALPPRDWVLWARSYGIDFTRRLANLVELEARETLWPEDAKRQVIPIEKLPEPPKGIDPDVCATAVSKHQLISAFGVCAGVSDKWFTSSNTAVKRCRVYVASRGRGGGETLYDPLQFINDVLLSSKRKTGILSLRPQRVWRVLKQELPHVYTLLEDFDPRKAD